MCCVGPREEVMSHFWDPGCECPPKTDPAEFLMDLVSVDTEDSAEARKDEERMNGLFHLHFDTSLHPKKEKHECLLP